MKLIPLTAKIKNGVLLNTPRVVYLSDESQFVPNDRKTDGNKYTSVFESGSSIPYGG